MYVLWQALSEARGYISRYISGDTFIQMLTQLLGILDTDIHRDCDGWGYHSIDIYFIPPLLSLCRQKLEFSSPSGSTDRQLKLKLFL